MFQPQPPIRFIADVHLGRLAHYLRMFGFDTIYNNAYSLAEQLRLAMPVNRCMLSRDPLLYKRSQGMPSTGSAPKTRMRSCGPCSTT